MTDRSLSAADLADRLHLCKQPRSWRGDCPACAYPRAFAVRAGRDLSPQLFCANGCDRTALNDAIARIAGDGWRVPSKVAEQSADAARAGKQAAALRLWAGSVPALGTIADEYLSGRALPGLAASAAFRYRADTAHPEGGRRPAMIALVQNAAGKPLAVHRTYLAPDGRGKARVDPQRAWLGPTWGGAVRLDAGATELVIGEGIETSASAGRLLGLPAWAALSAGNMAKGLILPSEVQSVLIAADRDPAGTRAAHDAATRWRAEGRRVRIAWPDAAGQDFNDLLASRIEAQRHVA